MSDEREKANEFYIEFRELVQKYGIKKYVMCFEIEERDNGYLTYRASEGDLKTKLFLINILEKYATNAIENEAMD